jgi:DNA-binding transcriptional ArsR family regulator
MDKTYKALADPTRRKILGLLRDADRTAGEIAAEFPIAWPSVSQLVQHLIDLAQRKSNRATQEADHA